MKSMENQTLQFKTNINCGGCVAAVRSELDNAEGICEWSVDTNNKDKVLTVQSNGFTADQVVSIIQKKGFIIEPINT
jgi:copper chaperone